MKIIFKEGGSITILTPSKLLMDGLHGTEIEKINFIAKKDTPQGYEYYIVEDEDVPSDRTFRSAWYFDGVSVSVDIVKAKIIANDKRRIHRDKLFAPDDKIIALNIPGDDYAAAEGRRAQNRIKNAELKEAIENSQTVSILKETIKDII